MDRIDVSGLRSELQRGILDLSLLEGQAAVMARHLSTSPLLTPEEKAFAGDRLCPDEAVHMRWTQDVASYLGRFDLASFKKNLDAELEVLRHRWTHDPVIAEDRRLVARINFDERFFVRTMHKFRFVIDRLIPSELAAGAERIDSDEIAHKAWGCAIIRRLEKEHPDWTLEIKRFQTIENYPAEIIARQFQSLYDALTTDADHSGTSKL